MHLPNIIDYNLVYQLIEAEWEEILVNSIKLVAEVTGLCQKTALTLFERHFKRFTGLLDLLSDKAR